VQHSRVEFVTVVVNLHIVAGNQRHACHTRHRHPKFIGIGGQICFKGVCGGMRVRRSVEEEERHASGKQGTQPNIRFKEERRDSHPEPPRAEVRPEPVPKIQRTESLPNPLPAQTLIGFPCSRAQLEPLSLFSSSRSRRLPRASTRNQHGYLPACERAKSRPRCDPNVKAGGDRQRYRPRSGNPKRSVPSLAGVVSVLSSRCTFWVGWALQGFGRASSLWMACFSMR